MPYSTIVAGTVITASWANANVRDQVVTPFTNAAARTSAISSPVEGMVSYLADVNRLDVYDGSVWRPVTGAAAKVVRGTSMLITTSTLTAISWSSASYDPHNMWSGGVPTRLTAPWTGFYSVSGTVNWESTLSGKVRRAGIYTNGTVEDQTFEYSESAFADGASELRQNVACVGVKLTATDFVEIRVFHDAGVDRNISSSVTNMKMVYLGPVV